MGFNSVAQVKTPAAADPWLYQARAVARDLARKNGSVTIDQVRVQCPPPHGIDPRIMGAVFTRKHFVAPVWVDSKRKECHFRPIRVFQLRQL